MLKQELNLQRIFLIKMTKSMQKIEDIYINKGFRGKKLKKILEKNKNYMKILLERKKKITEKSEISKKENKKYVLSTNDDIKILNDCKNLEKLKLNKVDKELITLIKSQLEHDWRKPLIKKLNKFNTKYKN